jgi:hypothetical protein
MQADRSMVGMFVDDSFLQPARRLVGLAGPHCDSHASLSVGGYCHPSTSNPCASMRAARLICDVWDIAVWDGTDRYLLCLREGGLN